MQNQPTSLSIINEFLNDLKAIDKGNHLKERLDFILNAVKGKKVLDIGIIDHSIKNCFSQNWMHGKILQEASNCIGVDILSDDIEKLRTKGLNVKCVDFQVSSWKEKFDVIVLGEILEHLDAPGYCLRNISNMLNEDGIIIITIPNPYFLTTIIKNCFTSSRYCDNIDHVVWFDPVTLQSLVKRHKLKIKEFHALDISIKSIQNSRAKIFFYIVDLILKFFKVRKEILSKGFLYVLIKDSGQS